MDSTRSRTKPRLPVGAGTTVAAVLLVVVTTVGCGMALGAGSAEMVR